MDANQTSKRTELISQVDCPGITDENVRRFWIQQFGKRVNNFVDMLNSLVDLMPPSWVMPIAGQNMCHINCFVLKWRIQDHVVQILSMLVKLWKKLNGAEWVIMKDPFEILGTACFSQDLIKFPSECGARISERQHSTAVVDCLPQSCVKARQKYLSDFCAVCTALLPKAMSL